MKKINKLKKVLKIFAVVLIILSASIVFCKFGDKSYADAGYHSSYSGGSSSSSSHSSSSGSSSSSYSSSSGSSSSSYSSSSGTSSSSSGLSSSNLSPTGKVIALIVICLSSLISIMPIIIILCVVSKERKNNNNIVVKNNEQAINEIKKYIPDFDTNKFLTNGYNIFVRIEEAWMNFDLDKVRDVISDEMFNMYQSQLTSMEMNGEQNIMKDFKLYNCAITSASKQNGILEVKTRYVVDFYDYIINKDTKKVVRGNSNRKIKMIYEFTFIENVEKTKLEKCPNCGAPINMNSSGICEYCNSKLVDDSTSWIMSKKVSLYQG